MVAIHWARVFEVVGFRMTSRMPASRQEIRRVSSVLAVKPMMMVPGWSTEMSLEASIPSRTCAEINGVVAENLVSKFNYFEKK